MKTRTLRAADADDPNGSWEPAALDRTVGGLHESRQAVVKTHIAGKDVQPSNVMQGVDEAERRFHLAGAIEPPYNPTTLAALLEHSNSLRQNIDAYATNIDGFGHRFEPVVDMAAKDANEKIASAIYMERQAAAADPKAPTSAAAASPFPTDQEVAERKKQVVEAMRGEKIRLDNFFEFCVGDMSFVALRKRVRQDLEVVGNGFVEVLRNGLGEIAEFSYMPAFTVRLLPLDKTFLEVTEKRKLSPFEYGTIKRKRQFRRYVQIFEAFAVYFKELGDPRVISRKTGAVIEDWTKDYVWPEGDGPATEVIHFRIHSSRTAYGVPRWIGNLLSVLGSRQAEEVNFLYFDNKSVPPLALLVSGGHLNEDSAKKLESYVQTEIKGKKNFHKILIVEAEGAGADSGVPGRVKVELKPLTDAQQKDALFGQYDERNMDKVGMAFRLPRMLRGDIRDFNRATADAALEFAEQQVFAPEREDFDFIMNRKIMPELGIRFWKFASMTPTVKDSAQLAEIINKLMLAGVLTPEEARELCTDVFNKELATVSAAWVKQPIQLTLAGVSPLDPTSTPWTGQDDRVGAHDAPFDDRDADGQTDKASDAMAPAITRTALGTVVTVNEARIAHGLKPWENEDGELTLAAYQEKLRRAGVSTAATGSPDDTAKDSSGAGGDFDGSVAGNPMPRGADGSTMTIGDLRDRGGLLGARSGLRGPRRRRPDAAKAADALVALRDALINAEARKAAQEFYHRKRLELAGALTPEAVRVALPVPDGPVDT